MPRYTQQNQPTSTQPNRNPYYVPSNKTGGGLFQKVKSFFNNSKSQNQTETQYQKHKKQQLLEQQQQQETKKHQKKPYNFDNVNVSAIDLSVNSNLSFISKNPNDTLSEFFNKKGDSPLNDIEIEGVMSLIRKSQSRAPSRNNSGLFNATLHHNHNRSMLLNSHMDSKLNGLSSFNNDVHNTTILRASSNNLKVPVKISTPTFVSRKPSSSNNHVNNNSTILNNSSMTNLTSSSIHNNANSSRSFINNGGIRKRRIVDYSSLQSPYKLKNSSSSLNAFLEKKKLLEKQANEEKNKSSLSISTSVTTKIPEKTEETKTKNNMVFNGGLIDLSALGEEEEEHFQRKEKKSLKLIKQEQMSKTASRVLDILNLSDAKNIDPVKEKPKIGKSDVEYDDSIIIVDEKPAPNNMVKPELVTALPSVPETVQKETTNGFSFSQPKKEASNGFSFFESKKETFKDTSKPTEVTKSEIPKFNFQSTEKSKLNTSTFSTKPAFTSESTVTPVSTPSTNLTKSINIESFETQPQTISSFLEKSKEEIDTIKSKTDGEKNELEVIDSFTFPEVEHETSVGDDVEHLEVEKKDAKEDINMVDQDNSNSNATLDFDFPLIPEISEKTLKLIQNSKEDIYNDVFKF